MGASFLGTSAMNRNVRHLKSGDLIRKKLGIPMRRKYSWTHNRFIALLNLGMTWTSISIDFNNLFSVISAIAGDSNLGY